MDDVFGAGSTDQMTSSKLLNVNPLIAVVDDFVSIEDCRQLIRDGQETLSEAQVTGEATILKRNRNSFAGFIMHGTNEVADRLRTRVGHMFNLAPEFSEPLQILRYAPGQYYKPHVDSYRGQDLDKAIREGGQRHQRYFTGLMYLNDGFEGGNTTFPRLGITVRPKRGRLLVWSNTMLGSSTPHPLSLHEGEGVISGEKWAGTFWYCRPPRPGEVFIHADHVDVSVGSNGS